ncbi:MAG: phospho-N-acetylmuramoyl-pentapeptide-transferase [Candidatus Aminicenantia bacterium]
MLYQLFLFLYKYFFPFNVFRYITVRTALAGVTSLFIVFFLTPVFIRKMKEMKIKQQIREELEAHLQKAETSTMGGIIIVFSIFISTILWADLKNFYIWIAIFTLLSFGLIGFLDDRKKILLKNARGILKRHKLIMEIFLSFIIGLILYILAHHGLFSLYLSVPFFKKFVPFLGVFYIFWIVLILISSSNAVNLTDGLDGLATGTTLIAGSAFTALSYTAGHAVWATYLNIPKVPLAGELTIFMGALVGACLSFLWYNCFPAQIFMGDVGSLSLGASIGVVGIMIKQELLLFFAGGLFVIEALSVLIQVTYFRITKGKRLLLMSPLHHHFEKLGWKEPQIVVRFWIIALIFAFFTLTTLKLR